MLVICVLLCAARPTAILAMKSMEPAEQQSTSTTPDQPESPPAEGPAQEGRHQDDDKRPPTPPHTGVRALLDGLRLDIKSLPSTPNFAIAATGGALALAVHPLDPDLNAKLRSHIDAVDDIFAGGKYYGGTPIQIALSLGTYAFGRAFDEPKVSHLGMDLLRAQLISELLVQPIKFATHRQRPDASNYQSFPSGHAAVTFAGATVIERHLGWKKAAVVYGVASYVAASRLHDNVHYASDVVFGAALGAIAGRTVTEHGRETWTFVPAFVPGGTALLLVHQ